MIVLLFESFVVAFVLCVVTGVLSAILHDIFYYVGHKNELLTHKEFFMFLSVLELITLLVFAILKN